MRFAYLAMPAALLLAGHASAQTREGQFAVRATVVADCELATQDLNFGTYDPAAAKSGQTVLTLRCTPGSAATLTLDGGGSGNPQARRMTGPANLNYQLFRDAAFQDPINTTEAAFELGAAENTGQAVPYTVYGQIPAAQAVPAGDYIDTVRVTVAF
jgi:spore coat protein U-like protein